MKNGMSYTVKEWFANKVANEVGRNITACDIFAIIKETEKAVYAMLDLGVGCRKTMWIPKSVLVEREIGEGEFGAYNHETHFIENYDEAVEAINVFWNQYR